MLKSCLAQTSRSVASSSRSSLHTSAILHAQTVGRQTKFKTSKLQVRAEKKLNADATREYAVLGLRPGQEQRWLNCDLAKAIITEDALYTDTPPEVIKSPEGSVAIPRNLNYGIAGEEKKLLFEVLPPLAAERGTTEYNEDTIRDIQVATENELQKANIFAKLVDLRNANAKGLAFENRRRCIAAFSGPDKSDDTGRPEVQAALLTMQIRNLWSHLTKFRKDVDNRRGLRRLVHQRAKILKYLKRLDRDRYEALLPRLGLEASSVEGELVV
ncbi:S15/NS1 RNA-binding domain-containing protein [Leucogyrophana mollusca]|uniref:S15/NS1 RNA-binding domain-containing protein n=1 Tax=Leucogyrophana mollusca TaxID=85980 RepID=A0ACB8BFE4_9AGAM|nr:S15/NS1 RNA-binding domain-containing protein [Leucogyrophana mollusca]